MARTKQTRQYDGSNPKKRKILGLKDIIYEPCSGFIIARRYNHSQKFHHDGYTCSWLCNVTQCPGVFFLLFVQLLLNCRVKGVNAMNSVIDEFNPSRPPDIDEVLCKNAGSLGGGANLLVFIACKAKTKMFFDKDGVPIFEEMTLSYKVHDLNVSRDVVKIRLNDGPMWYG